MRRALLVFVLAACGSRTDHAKPATGSAAPPRDAPVDVATDVAGIPIAFVLPGKPFTDSDAYAFDADHVFAIGSQVWKAAKHGGLVDALIAVDIAPESGRPLVATDEERRLLHATTDDPSVVAGAEGIRIYEYAKGYRNPVVHDGFLYAIEIGDDKRAPSIERVPIAGGKSEVVATDVQRGTYAVDADAIYVTGPAHAVVRIASQTRTTLVAPVGDTVTRTWADDGDGIIVADVITGQATGARLDLKRYPKSGKRATTITNMPAGSVINQLHVDASGIYWLAGHELYRIAQRHGPATLLATIDGDYDDRRVEFDDTDAWIFAVSFSSPSAQIVRVDKTGRVPPRPGIAIPSETTLVGNDATTLWLIDGDRMLALAKPK